MKRGKLAGLVTLLAGWGLVGASVADVVPSAYVTLGNDDNVSHQRSQKKSSDFTKVGGEIEAVFKSDYEKLEISIGAEKVSYSVGEADDFFDNMASIGVARGFKNIHAIGFQLARNAMHEDRGTGLTQGEIAAVVDEPVNFIENSGSIDYDIGKKSSIGRFSGSAFFIDREYTNFDDITDGRDRLESGLNLNFRYLRSAKVDVLTDIRYKKIDYDAFELSENSGRPTLDSTVYNMLFGLAYVPSSKSKVETKLGYLLKDFAEQGRDTFNGVNWEVTYHFNPTERSAFFLESERRDKEPNNSENLIDASSLALGWEQHWTARQTSVVKASTVQEKYISGTADRKDRFSFISLRHEYRITRLLEAVIEYELVDKHSTRADREWEKNIVSLSLSLGEL